MTAADSIAIPAYPGARNRDVIAALNVGNALVGNVVTWK